MSGLEEFDVDFISAAAAVLMIPFRCEAVNFPILGDYREPRGFFGRPELAECQDAKGTSGIEVLQIGDFCPRNQRAAGVPIRSVVLLSSKRI